MEVIPAIDVRSGKCVRLAQGDYARETVFGDDPVAMARRWASEGATRIHVVDLDGAREGAQANLAVTRAIVKAVEVPVQTGGGVRTLEVMRAALDAGFDRVALGTAAVKDPALVPAAVALAGDRVFVSVDARAGRVSLEGWTEDSGLDAAEFIARLRDAGVVRIVYTDILRDGVNDGPNFEAVDRLARTSGMRVIAAGGVGSVSDLVRLAECGAEAAIVGRAIYTGDVSLPEAIEAVGRAAKAGA